MATRRPQPAVTTGDNGRGCPGEQRGGDAPLPSDLAACHAELAALRARLAELEQPAAGQTRVRISGRLDQASVGYAELERDGCIARINRTGAALLGIPHPEVLGLPFVRHVEPADRPAFEALLQTTQAQPQRQEAELRLRSADGAEVWVQMSALAAPDLAVTRLTLLSIDGRKRAELALAESELRYRRLHESMTDAFACVDLNGRFLECNRAFTEMMGYSAEELALMTYRDLTPEPWAEATDKIVQEVLTHGASEVYEKEYRRKDGSTFPAEARIFLIRDDAGQPAAIWGTVRDVTARKQAEQALRESELRYRRLHESMTDAFALVDMAGRFREVNRAYCEMLGYAVDELRELTYVDLTPEPWRARELQIVQEQVLTQGASPVYEKEYRRKDGTVFPVELRTFLIRDSAGEPEAMWAIVRDITERKQAEDALRRERDLLASIMDTSPAGILVADRDGRLTTANRRAEELLGVSRDAITRRDDPTPAWRLSHFGGRPMADEELPFHRVMATGQAVHGVGHAIEWPDGRRVLLSVNSAPLTNPAGDIVAVVSSFDDVTARELASQQLRHQLALKQAWLQAVPLPVCFIDNDGQVVDCNAHFAVCLGRSRDAVLGASMAALLPAAVAAEERLRCLGGFRPDVLQRYLVLMPTASGEARIWIHKSPYYAADQTVAGHVLALVDVTSEEHLIDELRQARGSLRSLAAELVRAEERERRGLASEVHDGVAVALTVTQLRLAALELTVKDQAALEMVADLRDVVSEASSGVRAMLNSLSPTILYEFGLAAALRKLSEATTARFKLPVTVSHDGPVEQLPEATAVMLYQVARELVHNVVKHAQASNVVIRVDAGPEEVRLTVEDDGVGPPPLVLAGRFAATARFGLFSIRERIEHLGGQFRVVQGESGGTVASAVVPAAWPG